MEKEVKEVKTTKQNKTNKLLLALVIILGIAVVALTTFVCTVLFVKPNASTNEVEEKEIVAKEIKDIDVLTELSTKVERILSNTDGEFKLYRSEYGYQYGLDILKQGFTDTSKQYVILKNIEWKEMTDDVWVKAKQNSVIANMLRGFPETYLKETTKQISLSEYNAYSKKMFGEEVKPQAQVGRCPIYLYDDAAKMLYLPAPQCGGTTALQIKSYKSKFEEKGNEAYVYVNFAFIEPTSIGANTDGYKIYKDYDYLETGGVSLKNEYKSLESSYLVEQFTLNKDNYQDFSEYKFTFKQDKDNNYYIVKVEQTK